MKTQFLAKRTKEAKEKPGVLFPFAPFASFARHLLLGLVLLASGCATDEQISRRRLAEFRAMIDDDEEIEAMSERVYELRHPQSPIPNPQSSILNSPSPE